MRNILLIVFITGMAWMIPNQILSGQNSRKYLPFCGLKPGEETISAHQNEDSAIIGELFNKLDKIPLQKPHYWFLYLEGPDGQPIENAKITADGVNFQLGRLLKSMPSVSTHIGLGHYLVRNVNYHLPGKWTMRFKVDYNDSLELLSFDIEVGP